MLPRPALVQRWLPLPDQPYRTEFSAAPHGKAIRPPLPTVLLTGVGPKSRAARPATVRTTCSPWVSFAAPSRLSQSCTFALRIHCRASSGFAQQVRVLWRRTPPIFLVPESRHTNY